MRGRVKRSAGQRRTRTAKARLYATLVAAAFCAPGAAAETEAAEGAPAEPPEPVPEETAAAADLAGWRLCPSCGKLNEPASSFCMYCGADLGGERRPPVTGRRPPLALAPSLGFFGRFGRLGPGASFAAEGRRLREEATVLAVLDVHREIDFGGVYVASDTHVYFPPRPVRPYAFMGVGLRNYDEDVIAEFRPGAGVRYDYGRRGSFFYCGGGFAAGVFRGWEEYGPDTYEWNMQVWGKFHVLHFYADHAGVTFTAEPFFGTAVFTVGHAFAF
jgi:hypothetical protein